MITYSNADKVLKSVYLDVVSNQINTTTSPFYNMVDAGSESVVGKEFLCHTRLGISGGIGCSADDEALPSSGNPIFHVFHAPLINVFGNVEITDKALRASAVNALNVVDLLNNEMESLVNAAKFNFGRMLYQNADGELCHIVGSSSSATNSTTTLYVDTIKNVVEGMLVDVIKEGEKVAAARRVNIIDRANKIVKIEGRVDDLTAGNILTLQGGYKSELYGLEYVMGHGSATTYYGNMKSALTSILPLVKTVNAVNGDVLQEIMDVVDERSGSTTNLILASHNMRRKYLASLRENSLNVDYMELDGGFKSLCYNGVPVYTDRFVPENKMYFVNTDDFKIGQLTDWTWIEGADGRILRQIDNKAAYGATLVKYANLVCKRPIAQACAVYEEE